MRRWNGWGDTSTIYPLPPLSARYLKTSIGESQEIPDVDLRQVLVSIPSSQIPQVPWIETSPEERLYHARGQSLPDWIAQRQGRIKVFPDGVTYPTSREEIRRLLGFARQNEVSLKPYGGGTSVVGHINPLDGPTPILTVDLSRMNELSHMDETNHLATIGAGANGPQVEASLNPLGYTLGHFPQSFEFSTVGGWIATRSCGQQSYYYGRIEMMFAGGHVETFSGPFGMPCFPASAAGPDLRQLILGSEGRLGVITEATLRVRPLPEFEAFYSVFFLDWQTGMNAVRKVVQEHIPLSMLRLSDPQETQTTLALSGKEKLSALARSGLSWVRFR